MQKLVFTKIFKEDIKSSVKYIKHTLQAPAAAEKLKNEIKNVYKKIKNKPFMYPIVPDDYLASQGFRFTMVKKFILVYIVEEKGIHIIRFLYGHRNWVKLLKKYTGIKMIFRCQFLRYLPTFVLSI